jgi:hypothetical protein
VNARLKFVRLKGCLLLLAMFGLGCSSTQVLVMPMPKPNAEKLGRVQGSAGGAHLLPVYANIIPAGLNSRVQRAYDHALAQAPGATALTDVTIQEHWYWFVIGTWRHVTITGEAVK